jgi:hypothetical protein
MESNNAKSIAIHYINASTGISNKGVITMNRFFLGAFAIQSQDLVIANPENYKTPDIFYQHPASGVFQDGVAVSNQLIDKYTLYVSYNKSHLINQIMIFFDT